MMHFAMKTIWACALLLGFSAAPLRGQEIPQEIRGKIDAVIASAYQSAAAGFPCKVKTRGKPKILRWEVVDRCLNGAAGKVDFEDAARRLEAVRAGGNIRPDRFSGAVDDSLDAQAIAFEQVFTVNEAQALLPLTNSLLKFLPSDSLMELPVSDKSGTLLGTFEGIYSYERTGGLATASTYKLSLFQYKDARGYMQSAADKLLLDSYGVPWGRAKGYRGFRLPLDKVLPP